MAFLDKPLYLQRKCAAKPGSRDFLDGSVRRNLMLRAGLWFRMKPSTIDFFLSGDFSFFWLESHTLNAALEACAPELLSYVRKTSPGSFIETKRKCAYETWVDFQRNHVLGEAIQALGVRSLWLIKVRLHKVDAFTVAG